MALGNLLMIPFTFIFNFFRDPLLFPMCSLRNKPVKILYGDSIDEVDVVDLFTGSEAELGEGGFGMVKRAFWGTKKHPEVAIKRVDISPDHMHIINNELIILDGLKVHTISPALIACVQDGEQLYIVQELIDGTSLADTDVRKKLRTDRPQDIFPLLYQGFKAIEVLFKEKIIHNDIKPENVIINKTRKYIYLVDFGLASFTDNAIQSISGTPGYIAPGRFHKEKPTFLDDMYSWTITMAEVLGSSRRLFSLRIDHKNRPAEYKKLNEDRCFKQAIPDDCHQILFLNVIKIYKAAGFGDFIETLDPNKVNLTTLMSMIVAYNNFKFSLDQVIQILERIKLEIENTQVTKEDTVTAPIITRHRRKVLVPFDANIQGPNLLFQTEETPFKRGADAFYSIKSHADDEANALNQPHKKFHPLII